MASYQSKRMALARNCFADRRNNPPNPVIKEFMSRKLQETLYGLLKPATARNESKIVLELRMTQMTSEELQWLSVDLQGLLLSIQKELGVVLELAETNATIQDLNINAGNSMIRKADPVIWAWSWRIPSKKMAYGDTIIASSIIQALVDQQER